MITCFVYLYVLVLLYSYLCVFLFSRIVYLTNCIYIYSVCNPYFVYFLYLHRSFNAICSLHVRFLLHSVHFTYLILDIIVYVLVLINLLLFYSLRLSLCIYRLKIYYLLVFVIYLYFLIFVSVRFLLLRNPHKDTTSNIDNIHCNAAYKHTPTRTHTHARARAHTHARARGHPHTHTRARTYARAHPRTHKRTHTQRNWQRILGNDYGLQRLLPKPPIHFGGRFSWTPLGTIPEFMFSCFSCFFSCHVRHSSTIRITVRDY